MLVVSLFAFAFGWFSEAGAANAVITPVNSSLCNGIAIPYSSSTTCPTTQPYLQTDPTFGNSCCNIAGCQSDSSIPAPGYEYTWSCSPVSSASTTTPTTPVTPTGASDPTSQTVPTPPPPIIGTYTPPGVGQPSVNPQLDPGVQGALPRYNSDPAFTTGHKFMPPKNTEAISLVERFPWLYMDVDQNAQYYLYRETGGNLAADVEDPLHLATTSGTSNGLRFNRAPSNTEDLSGTDNGAAVDETGLNQMKCVQLDDKTADRCYVDILGSTVGAILDEGPYISNSTALYNRLQMDSCTNQMILPMGLQPNYVFNEVKRQQDDALNESWCQPMVTRPVDCYRNRLLPSSPKCLPDQGERDGNLYDYRAWGYLRLAWQGVLIDAYTPSGGTGVYWGGEIGIGDPPYLTNLMLLLDAGIPTLTGLTFPGTLQVHEQFPNADVWGKPFLPLLPGGNVGPVGSLAAAATGALFNYGGALTTINDLARQPYERIWDPTHPYSPRWDFKGTDRLFSELARVSDPPSEGIGFSTSTSTCIVRCAAVPVDILSFRLLTFTACMGCRIAINDEMFWQQVDYLQSDITFSIGLLGYDCVSVGDITDAVNDTSLDMVLGSSLTSIFNQEYYESVIASAVLLQPTYGRLHGMAGDYMEIEVLGFWVTIPEPLSGGCHNGLCAPCNAKSFAHDQINLDTMGLGTIFKKPQKNMFDSNWPVCSTKYDYQDQTVNIPQCYACTLISGDTDPLHGVRNCCDDLAHALAPINTLKIRNTKFNPGLKPTPEGYTFREYFAWRDDTRVWPYSPDSDSNAFNTNTNATISKPNMADGTWIGTGNAPSGTTVGYAASHMPYMRWWDTGTSSTGIGYKSNGWSNVDVGLQDYDPDSDCGAYDTLVGVGVEDWDGNNTAYYDTLHIENKPAWSIPPKYSTAQDGDGQEQNNAAKYCRYGGNGFATDQDTGIPLTLDGVNNVLEAVGFSPQNFFGIDLSGIGIPPFYQCIRLRTIDVADRRLGPDAMTSWDELKMYQMRAIQRGLNCLPQYEKMHKPFGSEEFALNAAGGTYNIPVQMNKSLNDNTNAYDPTLGPTKGYYKVPYKGAAPDAGGNLGNNEDMPGSIVVGGAGPSSSSLLPGVITSTDWMQAVEMKSIPWPLSWRGYVSEDFTDITNCYNTFPQFAGDGSTLGLNVGVATIPCGDINDLSSQSSSGESGSSAIPWNIPGAMSPMGNVTGPLTGPNARFMGPDFGVSEFWPLLPAGLGNAQVGDIVYLTSEDTNYALASAYVNWGEHLLMGRPLPLYTASIPYAAVVVGTHNQWWSEQQRQLMDPVAQVGDCPANEPHCFTQCESSVIIQENNNGKFPDVCGNTDMYGRGQTRTIYKEWIPAGGNAGIAQKLDVLFPPGTMIQDTCGHSYTTQPVGVTGLEWDSSSGSDPVQYGLANSDYANCADPKLSECTYADYGVGAVNPNEVNLWNHFRVYRPTWDIRQ